MSDCISHGSCNRSSSCKKFGDRQNVRSLSICRAAEFEIFGSRHDAKTKNRGDASGERTYCRKLCLPVSSSTLVDKRNPASSDRQRGYHD
ncbi:hypothetical protein L596_017715 [Steinernema carpocapsae]|uniref:Uncharacterized protein n=1 Tax=Steinernema carpocapsae TaxID=34508 RepID=A0A4U5N2G2_STECR|nr:hypothetical protein L596_017715 [Steinernema carpocapsae]